MARPRLLTAEQVVELKWWRAQHCSVKEKARRMGISVETLRAYLNDKHKDRRRG